MTTSNYTRYAWSCLCIADRNSGYRGVTAATRVHHIDRASSRTQHRDVPHSGDLSSTNVVSVLIEEGNHHGCLDSITSTCTVRRGGLSTSTMKSEAMHERTLCSCKVRLRRGKPDGRLTQRPSSSSWPASSREPLRSTIDKLLTNFSQAVDRRAVWGQE